MMKWLQGECNISVKNKKNVRWGKGLHIYFFKSSYYSSTTLKICNIRIVFLMAAVVDSSRESLYIIS